MGYGNSKNAIAISLSATVRVQQPAIEFSRKLDPAVLLYVEAKGGEANSFYGSYGPHIRYVGGPRAC